MRNSPQSAVCCDLSAAAALLEGGMLMAGSAVRIQSRKDSKVNYNIAVFSLP